MVNELLADLQIRSDLLGLGQARPRSVLPDSVHLLANWGTQITPSEIFLGEGTTDFETIDPKVFGTIDMYPTALWPAEYKGASGNNIAVIKGKPKYVSETDDPIPAHVCYALEIIMQRVGEGAVNSYSGTGTFTMAYNPNADTTGTFSSTGKNITPILKGYPNSRLWCDAQITQISGTSNWELTIYVKGTADNKNVSSESISFIVAKHTYKGVSPSSFQESIEDNGVGGIINLDGISGGTAIDSSIMGILNDIQLIMPLEEENAWKNYLAQPGSVTESLGVIKGRRDSFLQYFASLNVEQVESFVFKHDWVDAMTITPFLGSDSGAQNSYVRAIKSTVTPSAKDGATWQTYTETIQVKMFLEVAWRFAVGQKYGTIVKNGVVVGVGVQEKGPLMVYSSPQINVLPKNVAYYVTPVFRTVFSSDGTLTWTYEKLFQGSIVDNFETPSRGFKGSLFLPTIEEKYINDGELTALGNYIYQNLKTNHSKDLDELAFFHQIETADDFTTFLENQLQNLDFVIAYTFWEPGKFTFHILSAAENPSQYASLEGVAAYGYDQIVSTSNDSGGTDDAINPILSDIARRLEKFASISSAGGELEITKFKGKIKQRVYMTDPPISFFGKANIFDDPDYWTFEYGSKPNQPVDPWDKDTTSIFGAGVSLQLIYEEPT